MPPDVSGPQPRPSRYALFAHRLKDAHAALRDPRIPARNRAELTKRVLAITALARHDVTGAAARLEAFFSELSGALATATFPSASNPVSPGLVSADLPPSAENTATQG